MGHEVEAVALQAGHTTFGKFDIDRPATADALRGADVAIDFSQPDAVAGNARIVAEARLPLVIGTTGWESAFAEVKQSVDRTGIGCIVASNFSIGVNLFLEIVRTASKLMDAAEYDAYVVEAHHRAKKDYPSGTALKIAETMLAEMQSKTRTVSALTQGEPIAKDTLLLASIRSGSIPGTHTVGFESENDTIELTHRARSRRGFATGSVKAAEWIQGKTGFYRFEEHVGDILGL